MTLFDVSRQLSANFIGLIRRSCATQKGRTDSVTYTFGCFSRMFIVTYVALSLSVIKIKDHSYYYFVVHSSLCLIDPHTYFTVLETFTSSSSKQKSSRRSTSSRTRARSSRVSIWSVWRLSQSWKISICCFCDSVMSGTQHVGLKWTSTDGVSITFMSIFISLNLSKISWHSALRNFMLTVHMELVRRRKCLKEFSSSVLSVSDHYSYHYRRLCLCFIHPVYEEICVKETVISTVHSYAVIYLRTTLQEKFLMSATVH